MHFWWCAITLSLALPALFGPSARAESAPAFFRQSAEARRSLALAEASALDLASAPGTQDATAPAEVPAPPPAPLDGEPGPHIETDVPRSETAAPDEEVAASDAAKDAGSDPQTPAAPLEATPPPQGGPPKTTGDAHGGEAETVPLPAPLDRAAPAPAEEIPLAKTPGHQPPPQWEDAEEMVELAATGSIETCEALTFPLTLLPGVGSVLSSVFEWGCLIPGAMAVDYTQAFHGDRSSFVWQAGLGLIIAKLWREALKYLGIGAVIGMAVAGFGIAGALAFVAPYYIPVAIAGLITAGGVGFLAWKRIRAGGSDALFRWTYWLLTGEFEDEAHRIEVRERSPVKYAMSGANRAWALMATAAGAEPERELWFYVPVVGAWGKAMARADAVKAAMRRTGDDVLDEERIRDPGTWETMDAVVDGFAMAEGGLMATAHVLLIGGGVLFTVGTGFAALQYQGQNDLFNYAVLAGTTGAIGIGVASGGLVALGAREIVKAFRPFAAPAAYGFFAPEDPTVDANAE